MVIDFETYYDDDYSLSKMTTQEYIHDSRFEIIGAAIKKGDGTTEWYTGKAQVGKALMQAQAEGYCTVAAHNMMFDGTILSVHFPEFTPSLYLCTLSMARAVGIDRKVGGSLARVSDYLRGVGIDVPPKGNEVVNAKGKRLADFTADGLQAYAEYCITDVNICYTVLMTLLKELPNRELQWQDLVLKMHILPQLQLDTPLLSEAIETTRLNKQALIDTACEELGVSSGEQLTARLRSNARFAEVLTGLGVTPPVKPSPSDPSKEIYAFAKTDEGMQALLEHPSSVVQALAACRLGVKSTIEETRLERFLNVSRLPMFAMPLTISGAHTHRLGGADKLNCQNLPSGRVAGQSTALRDSIIAPEGKMVVVGDSAQVEARVLAYIAGQVDLLEVFENKGDPYSVMASRIYGVPADAIRDGNRAGDRESVMMRQLGKAAILGCGYGMGATRFQITCKGQHGQDISIEESQKIVDIYRSTNQAIVNLWRECEVVLENMMMGRSGTFGGPNADLFYYDGNRTLLGERIAGIRLPDGMWLNYANLRVETLTFPDGSSRVATVFDRRKDGRLQSVSIYGGALAENLTQALAFAMMKYQALRLYYKHGYRACFNVHDEFVFCVPEDSVEAAAAEIEHGMRVVPPWLTACPVSSEVGYAKRYGDC